ncbi:MAG: MerR family transcriptional regulator [Gammaproteobacteria bacterium]
MNATVTRAGRQVKTMCVSDVAQECNVRADTVRYYARIGLVRPNRRSNGYRQFGGPDIQRLNFIQRAVNRGCTLGEIRKILGYSNSGKSPCPMVRETLERRIKENRQRLKTQLNLQRRMEQALKGWSSMRGGVPNGESVCRLIEALGAGS